MLGIDWKWMSNNLEIISRSVCLLVHNEENNLRPICEDALNVLKDLDGTNEILIIDNASTDSTPEISQALEREYSLIRWLRLETNQLYSGGVCQALKSSRGDYIFIVDGDFQHPINQILMFEAELTKGYGIVFGHRVSREEPFSRKLSSFILLLLAKLLIGFSLSDVNCGIRAVNAKFKDVISPTISANLVNPELYIRARKSEIPISEVKVKQFQRPDIGIRLSTHNFNNPATLFTMVVGYLKKVRSIID
jgi:glycosyltransferase involved in cell wall biosynthesis